MSTPNDFSKLLKYLEKEQSKQKSKPSFEVHKRIQKIPDSNKQSIKKHIDPPVLDRDKFKKIKDVDHYKNNDQHSMNGFNVDNFESLMRNRLIDEHQKTQNYERPYISVSEFLYCLRKAYYNRLKYQIDISKSYSYSYLHLIKKVENTIQDYIQDLSDFDKVKMTIINEEYKIKGIVDAIKGNYLIEFKMIDPNEFEDNYFDDHYNQGLIYSYILNTDYNFKIDTISIVYISRNLDKIISFDLPEDSDKAIGFMKNALYLRNCVDSKNIPDPINSDSEQCKYCVYMKYCKEDDTDLVKPYEQQKQKSVFLL